MRRSTTPERDTRDRDRSRRNEKGSRFNSTPNANNSRDRSPIRSKKSASDRRVYISNIPYEHRWQDLKDLFRTEVGEVSYVELFVDENEKPRGCGIVEFEKAEYAQKAVEKMHRYELKGRKLVVKEDNNVERDKQGRPIGFGGRSVSSANNNSSRWESNQNNTSLSSSSKQWGNTYGLSPQFLESLNIQGPLITKVFVANLDYKVDEKKLKEVFKLAGRVVSIDLLLDKDGKSRGFGTIEFEHPVEAVQAISMFHNQTLYDRRMNVRMDKSNATADGPPKLPEGLKSIGMGLGANGAPLTDVARNLPTLNLSQCQPTPSAATTSALAALGSAAALASLGQGQMGLNTQLESRILDTALARRTLETTLGNLSGSLIGGGGAAADLASTLSSSGLGNSYGSSLGGNSSVGSAAGNYLNSDNSYGRSSGGLERRDYDLPLGLNSGGAVNSFSSDYEFRSGPRYSDTVLVSNLPPTVTWHMLKDKFLDVGDVKYAEVNGKDGNGIVRFGTDRDAERAVSMFNHSRIDGRTIEVRLHRP